MQVCIFYQLFQNQALLAKYAWKYKDYDLGSQMLVAFHQIRQIGFYNVIIQIPDPILNQTGPLKTEGVQSISLFLRSNWQTGDDLIPQRR